MPMITPSSSEETAEWKQEDLPAHATGALGALWPHDVRQCREFIFRFFEEIRVAMRDKTFATYKAQEADNSQQKGLVGTTRKDSLVASYIALSTLLMKLHALDHQRAGGAPTSPDLQPFGADDMAILERFVARTQEEAPPDAGSIA